MQYRLIRSKRRTISIGVDSEGVIVRAPERMPKREIDSFIIRNEKWIDKHLELAEKKKKEEAGLIPLTFDEIKDLADKAKKYIPERVKHYSALIGVKYGRVTIRNQRTRWGSCSSKGNLNFNCLLMLTPPEVIDSVVVHELCHLKEMNHSKRFYGEVLRVFPEYRKCERWLKENGRMILARMQ